jgi:hypothetical protein
VLEPPDEKKKQTRFADSFQTRLTKHPYKETEREIRWLGDNITCKNGGWEPIKNRFSFSFSKALVTSSWCVTS